MSSLRETFIYTEFLLPTNEFFEEEYAESAPIAFGRWTWRTAVVIVGIGTSFATFICAVFELTSSITMLALATTAILCFALYYVSRFEEQRHISILLDDLEGQVEVLEKANATYTENNDRLEKTEHDLRGEVTTLTQTNTGLTENLQTTASSLEEAKVLNGGLSNSLSKTKDLQSATELEFEKYKALNERFTDEIAKKIGLVNAEETKCRARQVELDALARRLTTDTATLSRIAGEVEQLEGVREKINREVSALRDQVTEFKQGLQTGAGQQDRLEALIAKLEQLQTLATRSTPVLMHPTGIVVT